MEEIIINAVNKYAAIAIGGVLVGLAVWLIKYFVINFMDMFKNELVNLSEIVTKDSQNTEKAEKTMSKLEGTISNHLVHNIEKLTNEISRLNDKK